MIRARKGFIVLACLAAVVSGCSHRAGEDDGRNRVIIYDTTDSQVETDTEPVTEEETEEPTTAVPETTTVRPTKKAAENESRTGSGSKPGTSVKETGDSESSSETSTDEPVEDEVPAVMPTTQRPAIPEETTTEPETTQSNVGLTAVARCETYVNVREYPTVGSKVLGKIYNNCAATILSESEEEDGVWYYMTSGNCTGYIKAEFFIVGEEAEALKSEIGLTFARVIVENLRVRSTPSLDDLDNVVTMYPMGTEVCVLEIVDDFAKIETDAISTGYVHTSCIEMWKEFDVAITIEEEIAEAEEKARLQAEAEAARIAYEAAIQAAIAESIAASEAESLAIAQAEAEAAAAAAAQAAYEASVAAQQAADAAAAQAAYEASVAAQAEAEAAAAQAQQAAYDASVAAQQAADAAAAQSAYEASVSQEQQQQPPTEPTDVNAALRNAIVAFALQFNGCPYVHGGRSLSQGTDCSGFTNMIYMNFGYTLDWTPAGQSTLGTRIPADQAKPGDLIFYSNNVKYLGHVALCIGNNQIIHACNENYGICIWNMYYREPLFAVSILG